MNEYGQSINTHSDLCDEAKAENTKNKQKLTELHRRMIQIENKHENLKSKHEEHNENLSKLMTNLLKCNGALCAKNSFFTGIDEEEAESEVKNKNCEKKICDFIFKDLGINDQMTFDRVHRIGKYCPEQKYQRPIVAKFHSFKDREKVRRAAPYALKGRKYGVREQFPTEIENKRKLLYPVMKKANEVEGNKVRLVRDKLFINDIQYIPKHQDNLSTRPKTYDQNDQPQHYQRNANRGFQHNAWDLNNVRTFSTRNVYSSCQPNPSFNFDMSNRFQNLPHPAVDPCSQTPRAENQQTRKKPASSPLESDNMKKLRDDNEYKLPSPPKSPSVSPKEPMELQNSHLTANKDVEIQ